jgi:hypothetical protein
MIVRRLTAVAALLVAAGLVLAQGTPKGPTGPKGPKGPKGPSKPAAGSLEDTLEKSLRNSADIKAAEAKVREAEAELNRVRQQVLTRATALHADLNLAKRMLAVAEEIHTRHRAGLERGITTQETMLAAQTAVEKHRGEVEKLQTELKSLRGEFAIRDIPLIGMAFDPSGQALAVEGPDGKVRVWDLVDRSSQSMLLADFYLNMSRYAIPAAPSVSGSMMDRVKKVLDQEVAFEASGLSQEEALRSLMSDAKSDIPVRALLPAPRVEGRGMQVQLSAGKLPVGAWVQALEDTDPDVAIVVRDYGLLITMKDRVPAGALRVQDLWKGNYAQLKTKKDDTKDPAKK